MTRNKAISMALSNHAWWTLRELAEVSGYPEASVSAGIRTLRRAGGLVIEKRQVQTGDEHLLYEYKLVEDSCA